MKPLQIVRLFHLGQFPYRSSYNGARRPNHLPDFNLESFLLEKISIMKKLSDFRKSVETGVDPRLT